METIYEILDDLGVDADFETCTDLIDGGILQSIDLVNLIGALRDEYDVKIPAKEIVPENFNSAQAIYDMMMRLTDE